MAARSSGDRRLIDARAAAARLALAAATSSCTDCHAGVELGASGAAGVGVVFEETVATGGAAAMTRTEGATNAPDAGALGGKDGATSVTEGVLAFTEAEPRRLTFCPTGGALGVSSWMMPVAQTQRFSTSAVETVGAAVADADAASSSSSERPNSFSKPASTSWKNSVGSHHGRAGEVEAAAGAAEVEVVAASAEAMAASAATTDVTAVEFSVLELAWMGKVGATSVACGVEMVEAAAWETCVNEPASSSSCHVKQGSRSLRRLAFSPTGGTSDAGVSSWITELAQIQRFSSGV